MKASIAQHRRAVAAWQGKHLPPACRATHIPTAATHTPHRRVLREALLEAPEAGVHPLVEHRTEGHVDPCGPGLDRNGRRDGLDEARVPRRPLRDELGEDGAALGGGVQRLLAEAGGDAEAGAVHEGRLDHVSCGDERRGRRGAGFPRGRVDREHCRGGNRRGRVRGGGQEKESEAVWARASG